jgi:hypothetical protein
VLHIGLRFISFLLKAETAYVTPSILLVFIETSSELEPSTVPLAAVAEGRSTALLATKHGCESTYRVMVRVIV